MTADAREPMKPCPFCGIVPTDRDLTSSGIDLVFVLCECGGEGPAGSDSSGAIAAWNRRAPDALLSSENEKLAGMVKELTHAAGWLAEVVIKDPHLRGTPDVQGWIQRGRQTFRATEAEIASLRAQLAEKSETLKRSVNAHTGAAAALTHHREAAKEMADALSVASACIAYWMPDETAVERRFHAAWVHDRAFVKQIDGILSKFTAPTPPAPAVTSDKLTEARALIVYDEDECLYVRATCERIVAALHQAESRGYERGKAERLKSNFLPGAIFSVPADDSPQIVLRALRVLVDRVPCWCIDDKKCARCASDAELNARLTPKGTVGV